jgi:hypothetical protein
VLVLQRQNLVSGPRRQIQVLAPQRQVQALTQQAVLKVRSRLGWRQSCLLACCHCSPASPALAQPHSAQKKKEKGS